MATKSPEQGDAPQRAVIDGAFQLLRSVRRIGAGRVSELQRDSGLPRTTVHRLLNQLESVGAVQHLDGAWQLGPALADLGTGTPGPRLGARSLRILMELAVTSGALVALGVEQGGTTRVLEVFPGARALEVEPEPGMSLEAASIGIAGLDTGKMAVLKALVQARTGDTRPVVDVGGGHPEVSCVAAPLRLSASERAAVWMMLPRDRQVPNEAVPAIRRAAHRIMQDHSRWLHHHLTTAYASQMAAPSPRPST
jgi:DNA-binding IclR family transcriptional regulator